MNLEPTFPDDSPEGMAETAWQIAEGNVGKQSKYSHFVCPACGSDETGVVSSMLRRRTRYLMMPHRQALTTYSRDILCQCNNPECPEGHGTQHFQWIEEVPEHDSRTSD